MTKGHVFLFGGERGIRTLERFHPLHDFQSCAFDQLSHLSRCCSARINSAILLDNVDYYTSFPEKVKPLFHIFEARFLLSLPHFSF